MPAFAFTTVTLEGFESIDRYFAIIIIIIILIFSLLIILLTKYSYFELKLLFRLLETNGKMLEGRGNKLRRNG